jgi:DNA ligase (NAD+)
MLSLSNTYSAAEVSQFVNRTQKQLPGESIDFFCELKFDGVAVSLLYQGGVLDKVVTRGDGLKGDDITQNAKQIASIPQVVQASQIPSTFEARGEVFMPLAQFEELNQLRLAYGEEPLANPRNATAGTLKTIKPSAGPKRLLDCYIYAFRSTDLELPTHEAGIQLLAQWGFPISPTYKKCSTLQEVLDYIDGWEHAKKELAVAIDGIVIKVNRIDQQERLGLTAKSPRWAIAYKYKPENVATILEKVTYQIGRTGIITPVAHFKPTLLAGTTVRKASLHNDREINRLGLHLGDTVFIEKGGDIIPKVTGVDLSKRKTDSQLVVFIDHCPACGTALVSRYKQTLYYCPNTKGCSPQTQALLVHFVQRKAMDIEAIGKKTIALLVDKGLVRTPADLYQLRYSDIRALEGFKDLSTQNILRGIQQSKQRPFERLLFGLGIPHVGEVVAAKLVQHYPTIEALIQANADELKTIPDIGEEIAASLIAYFQDSGNLQVLESLKQSGLQLSRTVLPLPTTKQPLTDKYFVISGTFDQFEREELKDLIKGKGGTLLTAISGQVDYLVAGHNPGPAKLAKAQALAIPVINEETMLKMLEL